MAPEGARGGDVLRTIIAERRAAVAVARRRVPEAALRAAAVGRVHHSLADRLLAADGTHIIAEMKRASPSAGLLRAAYDPVALAAGYAAAGACGLSVLTEPLHFQGAGEHLQAVRRTCDLPLLRKDFLCEPYQVYEAAAWGADVVLLIVAALEPEALRTLWQTACACGLEVLAEAHTAAELDRALALPDALIGVNSRNLSTLQTDLGVAHGLARSIPADRLAIAESGIRTRAEVEGLEAAGYRGFLVGETFMRQPDPGVALKELLQRQGAGSTLNANLGRARGLAESPGCVREPR